VIKAKVGVKEAEQADRLLEAVLKARAK